MPDEKRRIVYELMVEAKGGQKAKQEMGALGEGIETLKKNIGPLVGVMGAMFVLKGVADAIEDMQRFNAQLLTLGISGQQATDALHSVQDIAVQTGQSVADVGKAYGEAVDMIQVMGRSTDEAARSADAFIRIALAEGKSVQDAARYMETLGFAMDSGVLKSKEFTQMLKESNTFQQAAQEALGLTTKEIVAMAKANDLGLTSLTKVVLQMEKMGEQKAAITTTRGLAASIKAMFGAIPQGFMEGLNSGKPAEKPAADEGPGWKQVMIDSYRERSKAVGGLISAAGNAAKQVNEAVEFGFHAITASHDEMLKHERDYVNRSKELADEMAAHWKAVNEGMVGGTPWDPNYDPAVKAEAARKQAVADAETVRRAQIKETSENFTAGILGMNEAMREFEKKEAEKNKKAADEAAKKRAKEDAARQEYIWDLRDKGRAEYERKQDEEEKKFRDEVKKGLGGPTEDDIQAQLKEMTMHDVPDFTATVLYNWDQIDQATAVLEDSFAQLFTGGIHNAREFFAMVLQGLSNIFAQIAAHQASEGVMGWIDDILAGAKFGGGASTDWASMAANIGYSAKGNAFNAGRVVPMAYGGIVTRPTLFPMANGGTGLMGEAGPEAVMPLKRTSDGRLGVAASVPSVQIINNTGVMAKARTEHHDDRLTIILEAAQLGANMAEERINRSVRSGYGSTAQSVQRTYGLTRRL